MSVKSKIFAGAASAVVASGMAATGLMAGGVANAATSSCGKHCINLYSQQFGKNYVVDDKGQGQKNGTQAILWQASNSDPAEDWTVLGLDGRRSQGDPTDTVNSYWLNGLVSGALNQHYKNDVAFELEYTPSGVSTAQCLGVASTAGRGTKVGLEPCGASSKTLWVIDASDVQSYSWQHYVPLINGSDNNFDDPYVLTFPGGSPLDKPRPQLETYPLLKSSRGVVNDTQEWGVKFGVLR